MPISHDLKQLKSHGNATAAELAAFVRQMKGRRPQEVLGLVAQSGLSRGIFIATLVTAGFMAVGTFAPYLMGKWWPSTSTAQAPQTQPAAASGASAAPAAAATGTQQPAASGNSAPAGSAATGTAAAAGQTPKSPADELLTSQPTDRNKQDALQRLNMDETKLADPKKNPLEDKTDDLLKDLR